MLNGEMPALNQPQGVGAYEDAVIYWAAFEMLEGNHALEEAHAAAITVIQDWFEVTLNCPLTPELDAAIRKELQRLIAWREIHERIQDQRRGYS